MNDVQKKVLEILKILIHICEKWDIKYYLVCGSALGAVKYQGFVPWDDDIDVAMLRDDYERFLEVAPEELPEWCFLQTYRSDPAYPRTSAKLRNTNTSFIEKGIEHLPINHGIYLDVFPLDGYPENKWKRIIFEIRKKSCLWKICCAMPESPSIRVRIRNQIFRFLGYHKRTAHNVKKLEKLYAQYTPETSEIWCNHGNAISRKEYAPRWHYGEGSWATFEGLKILIPEQYDAYLTQKYGDWRADLPPEKQRSHHKSIAVDAEKSYTHYVNSVSDVCKPNGNKDSVMEK